MTEPDPDRASSPPFSVSWTIVVRIQAEQTWADETAKGSRTKSGDTKERFQEATESLSPSANYGSGFCSSELVAHTCPLHRHARPCWETVPTA